MAPKIKIKIGDGLDQVLSPRPWRGLGSSGEEEPGDAAPGVRGAGALRLQVFAPLAPGGFRGPAGSLSPLPISSSSFLLVVQG